MTVNFIDVNPGDAHPDGLSPEVAADVVSWAQCVFKDLFKALADLTWMDEPEGPLAYHWLHPHGQSATFLINLATTLNDSTTT